ncbi:Zn-ribbon domain-containing OB-fold protein [Shouchella sp. JSM 1781072]|uniref:Zn-ribbon domain-containing OB-fold protein n=1 Tax=Bacillaceae TaxID=186817 RepID=UPI000C079B07|nr:MULTISPECIES: OB-fold domain-containing protein [Bacillaceae]UTR08264.1 OB-fold domain-containing protein [Alkalihalobacillus sp. LMS6]
MEIPLYTCQHCKHCWLEEKIYCSRCLSEEFTETFVEGKGTVYSHTTIHAAPDAYQSLSPYVIALIDIRDHTRLSVRCTDQQIQIGDIVKIIQQVEGAYLATKEDVPCQL